MGRGVMEELAMCHVLDAGVEESRFALMICDCEEIDRAQRTRQKLDVCVNKKSTCSDGQARYHVPGVG